MTMLKYSRLANGIILIAQKPSIVLARGAAHSFGSLVAPEKRKEEQLLVELDQVTPEEGCVPSPHTPVQGR